LVSTGIGLGFSYKVDLNSLTKEKFEKAMECKTPEELIALAKEAGVELTLEQAKAYLEELQDVELDQETLDKVAGGKTHRSHDCPSLSKSDY
jgi:predicted peroxiredoxin